MEDKNSLDAEVGEAPQWDGPHHELYNGKISGGTITQGCGGYRWAEVNTPLECRGKHRIKYRVESIDQRAQQDILVGVASKQTMIHKKHGNVPSEGCYILEAYSMGDGVTVHQDSHKVDPYIDFYENPEAESNSLIEVLVDYTKAHTTVFYKIDGNFVGGNATPWGNVVRPEYSQDLVPVACVTHPKSSLTLVSVEQLIPDDNNAGDITQGTRFHVRINLI